MLTSIRIIVKDKHYLEQHEDSHRCPSLRITAKNNHTGWQGNSHIAFVVSLLPILTSQPPHLCYVLNYKCSWTILTTQEVGGNSFVFPQQHEFSSATVCPTMT